MSEFQRQRADFLAQELINICEELGDDLACDFIRSAVDRLHEGARVREDRARWGSIKVVPPSES